eukprot:2352340-Lingulodinium_polyedra.AAC.1
MTCPMETSLGPIIISRGRGGSCTKPFRCSGSMVPSAAIHRPRATTALANWLAHVPGLFMSSATSSCRHCQAKTPAGRRCASPNRLFIH